jgi:hypothetical protein
MRTRLLVTLGELAGDHHVLTLPGEALRRVAQAFAEGAATIDWSEPGLTRFIRDPQSITDEEADTIRQYLVTQEADFESTHSRAKDALRPVFKAEGGHERWTSVAQFLDEVWSVPDHVGAYFERLWNGWGLPGRAPVERILNHEAWRLYFDGWGAAVYARHIAHPQPGRVQTADLQQLVYFGPAASRVLATEDVEFRRVAGAILDGRYPLARVVSLDTVVG